jgi:hypothetical protein
MPAPATRPESAKEARLRHVQHAPARRTGTA